MARARIGELLVDSKVITGAQLEEALRTQDGEHSLVAGPSATGPDDRKLGQVLVGLGYVTETQLTQTLSLQLSVPWVSLYHIDFSRQLLNMVPRELAEKYCAVPIFVRNVKKVATLYVAMDDPTNEEALAAIASSSSMPVKPMIAAPSDIRSAIRVYYETSASRASIADAATIPPGRTQTHTQSQTQSPTQSQSHSQPQSPTQSQSASRTPSQQPPAAKPPPPPPTGRAPLPTVVDTIERFATEPIAPPRPEEPFRAPSPSGDAPDVDPELEVGEYIPKKRAGGPRMVALTLLDGTQLNLPARPAAAPKREGSIPPSAGGLSDQLTARDLVSALRAHAHGADASEILGSTDWQAMFAALLSLMLKKNLIADWEFVEELRNI